MHCPIPRCRLHNNTALKYTIQVALYKLHRTIPRCRLCNSTTLCTMRCTLCTMHYTTLCSTSLLFYFALYYRLYPLSTMHYAMKSPSMWCAPFCNKTMQIADQPVHNFPSNEQGVTFALYYAPLSGDLITTMAGSRAYLLSNNRAGKTGKAIQQGLIYI